MRSATTAPPLRSYLLAALGLGVLVTWASENLFWSSISADPAVVAGQFAVALAAYAVAAAAALTLLVRSGAQGWAAAFLGGAMLGWAVEGVVVGTMYDAFPWQVVWTPLAWHALVSGLVVVGLARSAASRSAPRQALYWLLLGIGVGAWALYWPGERAVSAAGATVTLLLPALALPVANVALERVGLLPRDRLPWWMWVAPALLALGWVVRLVASGFTPPLLAWPVAVGAAYAVARRQGDPATPGLLLGEPAPLRRHLLALLAPATAATVAGLGWSVGLAVPTGPAVYVGTSLASLALLARLVVRPRRAGEPALTEGR
ncbi:MAG: hypothetical protein R2731_07420 [Nocardioides sp.]